MASMARSMSVLIAITALGAVGSILWPLIGMPALGLIAVSVSAAASAAVMWQRRFNRSIIGVICIAGGALGSIVAAELFRVNISLSPVVVFSGSVCGAATWIIGAGTTLLDILDVSGKGKMRQSGLNTKDRETRAYLLISLTSLMGGPVLGGLFYILYAAYFAIPQIDRFDCLSHHIIIGAIGGLLIGLPHLWIWFVQSTKRTPREEE